MTHPFNAPGLTLWQRLVAPQGFIAAVLVVTASKFVLFDANLKGLKYDLLVVPLLLAAYWIGRKYHAWGHRLLFYGALSNVLIFVPFNPVRRAGPIFAGLFQPIVTGNKRNR